MAKNIPEGLYIDHSSKFAYMNIKNAAAAAIISAPSTAEMFEYPDAEPKDQETKTGTHKLVSWGSENNLPQQIIEKVGKVPVIRQNLFFNSQLGYGSGIVPVKRTPSTSNTGEIKIEYTPVFDNIEINEFFENNDVSGWFLEQLTDLGYFYHGFSSLLLNKENPESRKVVELRHRDASFCRWAQMNEKGIIETCLYSPLWGNSKLTQNDIIPLPVLDFFNPTLDLKRKIGREVYPDAKKKDDGKYEYIISVNLPSPGRSYYRKPPWYALIESGWYDFATMIPEFKKAILKNQMTIKYVVYISENYFKNIFSEEGIKEDKDKKARVTAEYKNIQDYLSGSKNAGKAVFGRIRYTVDGKEQKDVVIEVLDHKLKGGEYLEDSQEISNVISYGMGTHNSLVGPNSKNGQLAGTEARELFIIKQAIQKPIRDRLLKPLYVIKAINKWPDDIHFIVPNIELTTLDSGTGSKKVIS